MQSRFSRFLVRLPTLSVVRVAWLARLSQPGSIGRGVTEPSGAVVANGTVRRLDAIRNQTSSTSTDSRAPYELAGFKKSISGISAAIESSSRR